MTSNRRWRRINKPRYDYELRGKCDPVTGVAFLFSGPGCGDRQHQLYVICANTLDNAHMDTYDEPPMSLAEAKKISRAWVADNERPIVEERKLQCR